MEGALKLKEISYIHAEGYPAAEMKHGPIALIDENMPVIVTATNKSSYEKIISNVQEVKARKGIVIAIVPEGEKDIKSMADYSIEIPETKKTGNMKKQKTTQKKQQKRKTPNNCKKKTEKQTNNQN